MSRRKHTYKKYRFNVDLKEDKEFAGWFSSEWQKGLITCSSVQVQILKSHSLEANKENIKSK